MRNKIEVILKGFHFEKLMGVVDVEDILKWKIKKLDAIKKRGNRLGKKGIIEQGLILYRSGKAEIFKNSYKNLKIFVVFRKVIVPPRAAKRLNCKR